MAHRLMGMFVSGEIDRVEIIYHHFKSMGTQILLRETYLPIDLTHIIDEEEQKQIKAEIPKLKSYLSFEIDKSENLQKFINKVKQITELKELAPELIHEFINKIVVYAPRYLNSKRVQVIDIYYNGVGILRELTPEEMENAFKMDAPLVAEANCGASWYEAK